MTSEAAVTALGSHASPVGSAGRAHEMTDDQAQDWWETTERIGHDLLPYLEKLAASLPSVTSVMVSTADGFNLCSMGLDEGTVDRVSAMGSALHSVARSAVESLGRPGDSPSGPPESLTIAHDGNTTVVLTVPAVGQEHALLWVTGSDDSLGAILFRARAVVPDVSAILGTLSD